VHILLSVGFIKAAGTSAEEFWNATASPRVVTDYKLSFAASLLAASINAVFGLIPARAWTAKRQGRQF
jgi:sulfate transport system permease protein